MWTWLEHLDRLTLDNGKVEPVLVFATLFTPALSAVAARYKASGERVVMSELLNDLLLPVCCRISMPKWMSARVLQIMANQTRFVPDKKKRFSRRGFVAQDCFPETLALYQMGLAVAGEDTGAVSVWSELRREVERENPLLAAPATSGGRARPPRKRPPRGRRR